MERNDELNGLHIEETGLDVHHILNDFDMDAELNGDEDPEEEETEEPENDGQPDEAQEWHDFDPDC